MQIVGTERFIIYGFEGCHYCSSAIELLESAGYEYIFIPLDEGSRALREVKRAYAWSTAPIILAKQDIGSYILIGGFSDLKEMLDFR